MQTPYYLIVKHSDPEILLNTLQDFANLYHSHRFTDKISVYQEDKTRFIIELTDIDEEHFFYAVNYFHCPESQAKFCSVLGYNPASEMNYFIPQSDVDYDNCYSVDKNGQTYKHIFDGSSISIQPCQPFIKPVIELEKQTPLSIITANQPVKKSWLARLFS